MLTRTLQTGDLAAYKNPLADEHGIIMTITEKRGDRYLVTGRIGLAINPQHVVMADDLRPVTELDMIAWWSAFANGLTHDDLARTDLPPHKTLVIAEYKALRSAFDSAWPETSKLCAGDRIYWLDGQIWTVDDIMPFSSFFEIYLRRPIIGMNGEVGEEYLLISPEHDDRFERV